MRNRQNRGIATGRGGARGRGKIIGHHDIGPGLLRNVDVAVDAAGQCQQTRCIDLPRAPLDPVGDAYDAAIANGLYPPEFIRWPLRWCRRGMARSNSNQ